MYRRKRQRRQGWLNHALKLLHFPTVDTYPIVDASLGVSAVAAGTFTTIPCTMKDFSESHRVLENLVIRALNRSQTLPLSTDQQLSILFLSLFLACCFVIYPFFICPTANIPGSYFTSTAIDYLPHFYHKHHDNAHQRALEFHKIYGSVVRFTPTLGSVNNPTLLPSSRASRPGAHDSQNESNSIFNNDSAKPSFSTNHNKSQ